MVQFVSSHELKKGPLQSDCFMGLIARLLLGGWLWPEEVGCQGCNPEGFITNPDSSLSETLPSTQAPGTTPSHPGARSLWTPTSANCEPKQTFPSFKLWV